MTIVDQYKPDEKHTDFEKVRPGIASQIVGGAVVLGIGILWLLERAGVVALSLTAVLAIATLGVGISLMLLARRGAFPGLIVFGSTLGVIAFLTALAPLEGFQGGVGDRTVVIEEAGDLDPDYNLAMGKLTVDLSDVDDLAADSELAASTGLGELVIIVPEGMRVEASARVGAGVIEFFGEEVNGIGLSDEILVQGGGAETPTLVLDLEVFMGKVEVSNG